MVCNIRINITDEGLQTMGTFSDKFKSFTMNEPDVFVETGTCLGASVDAAIKFGFQEIHSVELSQPLFEATSQRFKDYGFVTLHQGTSPEFLRRILPDLRNRFVVLWLDAHYQGDDRANQEDPRYGECPLLQELQAILSVDWQIKPVIVIDDAQMLEDEYWVSGSTREQFDRHQWPTLAAVKIMLNGYNFVTVNEQLYCW